MSGLAELERLEALAQTLDVSDSDDEDQEQMHPTTLSLSKSASSYVDIKIFCFTLFMVNKENMF